MKIILASQSPRRKEILENLGYGFEVVPSGSDEKIELEEGIDHAIEELAVEKAKEVRKRFPDDWMAGFWENRRPNRTRSTCLWI